MATNEKAQICDLLRAFIHQRPGLEFGNYGDVSAYRSESRAITRDLHDAETLLAYVERHDSIGADRLRAAFRDAYSGRLTLVTRDDGRLVLDYCTGQYWPTEYRKAACAVLASAIWDWMREHCMPAPMARHASDTRDCYIWKNASGRSAIVSAGDYLRAAARREFGATIARRWFN